jgi:hypothetical protein
MNSLRLFADSFSGAARTLIVRSAVRVAAMWRGGDAMLTIGMVVLGLATFAAMLAFVTLCDRV